MDYILNVIDLKICTTLLKKIKNAFFCDLNRDSTLVVLLITYFILTWFG